MESQENTTVVIHGKLDSQVKAIAVILEELELLKGEPETLMKATRVLNEANRVLKEANEFTRVLNEAASVLEKATNDGIKMPSALLLMEVLIKLYHLYFLAGKMKWEDIVHLARNKEAEWEDSKISTERYDNFRMEFNEYLDLVDVDIYDMIRVVRKSYAANSLFYGFYEEMVSFARQQLFLQECRSVTNFPTELDSLRLKLLNRLSLASTTLKIKESSYCMR